MTQVTSKPRVKNDSFGNQGYQKLFDVYNSSPSIDLFRTTCVECIESSSGSRKTKDEFIHTLNNMSSINTMLKTVTNYMLAGEGKGV